MSALLEIEGLAVDLPPGGFLRRRGLDILSGIDLTLARGETLALVGESGSGKTTLARAIFGLQRVSAGVIRFDGGALDGPQDFARLRRSAAMMFQDPVASLSPRMTVGALLTEPHAIHGPRLPDPRARAVELLAQVGLPAGMAGRYPHELSGGQARRVGVARALALRPQLVVADEPTAGLDVSVQAEILNLMSDLKDALGLSYLVITHNLALVRHIADRIAVLYLGRLVETGPAAEVFARPAHPYTESLIAAEPVPDPRRRRRDLAIRGEMPGLLNRPSGCVFHTRCPLAAPRCRDEAPALREAAPGRRARCHFDRLTTATTTQGELR